MPDNHQDIRQLVTRVRRRWHTLALFRALARAALAAAAVLIVALVVSHWTERAAIAMALTGVTGLVAVLTVVAWAFAPLRRVPTDARVARFIEERAPSLDDRLASAIDVVDTERQGGAPMLATHMLADAAARARALDRDAIVPSAILRRAALHAAAAGLLLGVVGFRASGPARQAYDAASLALFPARLGMSVPPGHARVIAGGRLAIEAAIVGSRAPVTAQVQIGDGESWRAASMSKDASGRFRLAIEPVTGPFRYRVVAGPATSPTYAVAVSHPPRVTRIDVDYTFPPSLGLKPRTEEDSGDIYAPAGTDVRLRVHTDGAAVTGHLAVTNGTALMLSPVGGGVLTAALTVVSDTSYRVALADRDGLSTPGDAEYFIRTLDDRPPEVHIVKPAADRAVTRLEEVDVEAQAEDDYGIERLDLVYSVRGSAEKVAPFSIAARATSVSGRRTLYLEDLDVKPGDFVSYYVRARDLTRGRQSSEARSDLFFLEVKPFEQEFSLAQSQSMAGAGHKGSIDDLVDAQKAVLVATFKLDKRQQIAKGTPSAQDARSISRTEADLKARVEQTSTTFRESTMRDPRRRAPARGGGTSEAELKAGRTMPEEDSMAAAAEAMGRAVAALDRLKTGEALSPEAQALSFLLKAQAEVKERQVMRQQAGAGGPGNNNKNYDISTLFDKELKRQQHSNYEMQASAEQKPDSAASALDKISELARRQDELVKRQQQLAREREKMTEDEIKRELEKLTREQSELRQRAEEIANGQQSKSQRSNGQQGRGQPAPGSAGQSETGRGMRDVSEEMRNAAGDLRRQDPAQASARGARALKTLRDLERQLQAQPDQQRRALGDMQLETRQLADAERQIASEAARARPNDSSHDTMRRLAGDQDRLAERLKRLQQGLQQQAAGTTAPSGQNKDRSAQAAAGEAARDIERQRLADRMEQAAARLRAQASTAGGKDAITDPRRQAGAAEELARALDKLADKLGGGTGVNEQARKLADQLSRAQELRDRLDNTAHELETLRQRGAQSAGASASAQKAPGDTGRSGRGESGGGKPAAGDADFDRLSREYAQQLNETQDLMEQMRREDPSFSRGGAGFTFEGQGMTLAAPGTEAFKQDFARWENLRRQATTALDRAESSLSKKLRAQEAKDRLAAGVEERAPAEYQKQVDDYFKALATKKKQ